MKQTSDIPVVILCGGRGTRLGGGLSDTPKPLVEVGGMPIIWHVMSIYARDGFRRFVLCLGHRGEMIREWFVRRTDWRGQDFTLHMDVEGTARFAYHSRPDNWSVTFVDTGLDTETGGRLKKASAYFDDAIFFVSYADGVSSLSPAVLFGIHRQHGCLATMTCVRPSTHYGIVDIMNGRVAAYREKPHLDVYVNGGFFCFNREVLCYIDDGEALEREPVQRLIAAGCLGAYVYDGFWHCMDTPKDSQVLNEMWAHGQAPWRIA